VARIATGEETEGADDGKDAAAVSLGRKGGKLRAEALTKKHCQEGVCWLENVNPWLEHTGDVANLFSYRAIASLSACQLRQCPHEEWLDELDELSKWEPG
jgi:hypothetical protein